MAQGAKNSNQLSAQFKWGIFGLFLIAISIIGIFGYVVWKDLSRAIDLGAAGDFFGGMTNPLLTFLTFMGVLFTIVLQRQELTLTRDELARSADALENQIATLNKQNFDSTFFQMLALHNDIVNSIDLVNSETKVVHSGRDCFSIFYTRLTKVYRERQKKGSKRHPDSTIVKLSYRRFWKDAQLDLGHYYRYLFNVVKFVDAGGDGNSHYMNVLRAQISDQELLLLFYNGLSKDGSSWKEYIEKWALFDNLPQIRLLDDAHKNHYELAAFDSELARSNRNRD